MLILFLERLGKSSRLNLQEWLERTKKHYSESVHQHCLIREWGSQETTVPDAGFRVYQCHCEQGMRNGLVQNKPGMQSTYLLLKIMFIYIFLGVLDFRRCAQSFPGCRAKELLPSCSLWVSHCGEFSCRPRAPGTWASIVAVQGLRCSATCGIFPAQGLNQCPLHFKVDS